MIDKGGKRLRTVVCLCGVLISRFIHAQLPAFPGAEGFGSLAAGGRGGDVYYVTNLEASGVGSFAYGVENAPVAGRTILFKVSGHIRLPSGSGGGLTLSKSKITVAGQTAPGDGICFWNNTMNITGNDLVFRHIRWRYGYSPAGGDSVDVSGSQRIIFDHCEVMFSTDENLSSFGTAPEHMTFQWSINAWGLNGHSCGGLWKMRHATVHNTLWANNHTRNPKLIGCDVFDWVNNLTFGWDLGFNMAPESFTADTIYRVNIRNSSFVHGGSTTSAIYGGGTNVLGDSLFRLHMSDVALDGNNNGVLDVSRSNYQLVASGTQYNQVPIVWPQTTNGLSGSPTIGVPVSTVSRMTAYKKIVSQVGATRMEIHSRPLRDEISELCVSRVSSLQRGIISNPLELNLSTGTAFASIQSTPAPADSDLDGMPDDWEDAVGYDKTTADNNTVLTTPETAASFFPPGSPTGYTRLEEYLHFKAAPHGTVGKNTAASPSYIDIDLRNYTFGFTVLPAFTISNTTGGTTTQSGSGNAIVRFTPTQNSFGRGGFHFTVTDVAGDTWTQQCCLIISTQAQPRPVTWIGDGTTNNWDSVTANFSSTLGPVAFADGDAVTINDSGSNTPTIKVTGALSPALLTVANSTKSFTLQGTGSLSAIGRFTKSGSGTLTISNTGPNNFNAATLEGGTLTLATANALGSAPVFFTAGTLGFSADQANALIIGGSVAVNPSGSRTLNGTWSGAGTINIANMGSNLLTLGGSMANFVGDLLFGASTGSIRLYGNTGSAAAALDLGSSTATLFTRNGGSSFSFGSLAGASGTTLSGASSATTVTTYMIGALDTSTLFAGRITNGGQGLTALTKTGSGTLTLTGNSTHSGATQINSGSLALLGTFGTSPVNVAAGAILTGTGTMGGSLTTAAGAIISPGANSGASAGTLTSASLNLVSPTLEFDLSSDPSAGNDRIVVSNNGAVTLAGTLNFSFRLTDAILAPGTYELIAATGLVNASEATLVSNLPTGTRQTLALETHVGGVRLVVIGNQGCLTWTGANGARWDVQNTAAWSGATPATFYAFDTVRFDDTAAIGSVTIHEPVAPQRITVSNTAARAYTFTGGPITGEGMLLKQGSGTLTLNLQQVTLTNSVTTAGSPALTVLTTNGLFLGMTVIGTGIPAGTLITELVNAITVTLSQSATASSSNASLVFETRNTYSGGTLLDAGALVLACNTWQYYSSSTPPPANPFGLGSGPITLNGGTLTLLGHTGNAQHLYGALPNDLIVPAGKSAILKSTLRGTSFTDFAGLRGSLIGSGTLNLVVNFKYGVITGDWSAFSGTLNVTRPSVDANDPRFQLGNPLGLPLAAVSLDQVQLEYNATLPVEGITLPIGSLSGNATAVISGGQIGIAPVTWRVGGLHSNATFAGSFMPYSSGGPIGLAKTGSGIWTLTGSGSVNAGITIEAGTLSYGDAATDALTNTAPLTVYSDAVLQLNSGATIWGNSCDVAAGGTLRGRGTVNSAMSCGGTLAVVGGTLALAGEAYLSGVTSFSALTDRVAVAGDLALDGRIDLPATGLSYGRKTLITYTGTLKLGALAFGALPAGYLALLDTTVPGEVAVKLVDLAAYQIWQTTYFGNTTDPAGAPEADPDGDGMSNYEEFEAGTNPTSAGSSIPLVWSGGGANAWNQATSANWLEGTTKRVFRDGRVVIFNDSGTNTPAIDLHDSLRPGAVVVTNTSKAYTFDGGGALDGPMSLDKRGSGTLSVLTPNSYTGMTTVAAGILNIQSDNALGSGAGGSVVSNNARLELQGGITVSGEALSLAGQGGATFYNGALNSKSGLNTWNGPINITASGTRIGAQAGASLHVSGVISSGVNTYGLTIRPADMTGSVILSARNTYLGDTAIFGGPLVLEGGADRLPVMTVVKMGSGTVSGRFDLNGCDQCLAGLTLVAGTANSVTNSAVTEAVLAISNEVASTCALPLGGLLALTKKGSGQLILTTRSTYTGDTRVDNGTLHLNFASLTTPSNLLATTSDLLLNNGSVRLSGKSGSNTFQTLGELTVLPGTSNTIELVSLANEVVQLTLGNVWTIGAGAVVLVDLSSSSNTALRASPAMAGSYLEGVLVKDRNGIGPATVVNGYVVRHVPTVLAKDSNQAQTIFSSLDTAYTAGTLFWNNEGLLTNRSVYALLLDTAKSGGIIDMGFSNSVLTLTSGAVSFVGTNDLLLTRGQVGNTGTEVLIDTEGSGVFTVASRISGGAGRLTLSGSGIVQLTATNTYSAGTVLEDGGETLIAAHSSALGTGAVSIGTNATLHLNVAGTVTVANTFAGAGNLRLQLSGVAAANTYINNVTAYTGDIRLTNVGGTGNKWNLNNRGNLGAGLTIDSGSQIFASGGTNVFSKGILVSGTGNNENRGAIRLIGTLGGPITLLDSATIGSEGGFLMDAIQGGVEGQQTLTFGTTNSKGNATVLEAIRDGAGVVSLLKAAAGTLTLMGTNSYSGTTTISAGTLKITTPAALPATSAILLNGGILDLSGASHRASPAIVPSLAGNGGTLRLSTTDQLVVTGNMTGTLVVSISDPQSLVEGTTYIVATYGGMPPAVVLLQNLALPWRVNWTDGTIRVFKAKGTLLNLY